MINSMALSDFCRIIAGVLLAEAGLAVFPITLRAQSAPANDYFANAIVISGASDSTNVTYGLNVGATGESGEPGHGQSYATSSVWWSWTATSTRSISISTEGSSFDTLLGVYTGDSVSRLATVTVNDDDGNLHTNTSRVLFRAIAGETYLIAVDGFQGATGNIRLTIAPAGISTAVSWESLDINGVWVRSADLRDRVLLIDFWSITCPPCLEELPHLATLHNQLKSTGFQVVGLFKNTQITDVQSLISSDGIQFPMAELTPTVEAVLAALQPEHQPTIQGFPTTYVFDREDRLVAQILASAKDLTYLENLILPLVRTSNSIRLKANWAPDGLQLSWAGADKGDLLESTSDLSSTNWSQVLNIFGQTGLTVSHDESAKFYRVRRPSP